jgi:hypothetical protein
MVCYVYKLLSSSKVNCSNSASLILVLASNNFSASSPAGYLQSGLSVLAILRTTAATSLKGEPFSINAFYFSISLFIISAKDEVELAPCNFFGIYMLWVAISVLIAPGSITATLNPNGASSNLTQPCVMVYLLLGKTSSVLYNRFGIGCR